MRIKWLKDCEIETYDGSWNGDYITETRLAGKIEEVAAVEEEEDTWEENVVNYYIELANGDQIVVDTSLVMVFDDTGICI